MRFLMMLLWNAGAAIWLLVGLPIRLLAIRNRPAYVRFRLAGDPPYRASLGKRRWRRRARAEDVRSIETFRRQVERLITDRRVRGIILWVEELRLAPAKRDALAEIITQAKAAGKDVVGFSVAASSSDYELLTFASRVVVVPAGRIDMVGFAAEGSAVGRLLNTLGIGASFVRRGDYKTAPELFTRETVSEIQRQTLEELLDERYRDLVEIISRNRGLGPDDAKRAIDEGPYSAKRALAAGLCDALVNEVDLPDFLAGKPVPAPAAGAEEQARAAHKIRIGSFRQYARSLSIPPFAWQSLRRRPRIAVVPIKGIIAHGEGGGLPGGPIVAGSESAIAAVRAVRKSRCKAVVLYVDSPGGSALASDLILEEVKRTSAEKTVVAYFDRMAASGGYMALLGAEEIWAAPRAIVGSIGVFAGKFDVARLFEHLGISRELVAKGANAGLYSLSRPFSEHELKALEAEVDETYQAFLQEVATARKRSKEEIHQRAEGRVYSGARAEQAGLVDRVGSFDQACRRALELAGIVSKEYDVFVQSTVQRRIPLLHLLRWASQMQVYSLWLPGLAIRGLTDARPLPRL